MLRKTATLVVAGLAFFGTGAQAQSTSDLSGQIGAGAIYRPDYVGSDDYEWSAFPAGFVSYQDFYFTPLRGLGWNYYNQGKWTSSIFLGYYFGRDDTGDIRDFEKVDGGVTGGLSLTYRDGAWTYDGAIDTPMSGDVDGFRMRLSATWQHQMTKRINYSITPKLTYLTDDWTEDMFSVNERDAMRSGIDQYHAGSGSLIFGVAAAVNYQLTPKWTLTATASADRLTGDAKDSPITDDEGDATQFTGGMFASYRF